MYINRIIAVISCVAVVLLMALIFTMSYQVAEQSNQLSTGVTEIIVNTVEKVNPNVHLDIKSFNNVVRKNAHFFMYLILGLSVINALCRCGHKSILIALLICILYAISDEVHQLFVVGRGAQVKDVLIDSSGSICGICIYILITKIKVSAIVNR